MHDAYMWVKFLHQLAAVAWLGWLLLAPAWLGHALACNDPALVARMRKRATWLTGICILGGGAVAWSSGWPMARTLSPDAFDLHWLRTGTGLFLVASVVWLFGLLPLYRHLLMLRERTGAHVRGLALAWRIGAIGCAVLGLMVLWLMTVRPI